MELEIQHSDTELADNATAVYPLGLNNRGETHTGGVTKTHVWNRGIPLRPCTRLEYRNRGLDGELVISQVEPCGTVPAWFDRSKPLIFSTRVLIHSC